MAIAVKEKVEAVKKKIEQIKRSYHFKKENDRRKHEAQLTKDLMDCAGDLAVCRSNYERAIRLQSEEIREGMAKGYPVTVQKNLIMDAAVGYMLVNEALFVIQSVASYDSIVDAYALLDMAAKTIAGEKVKMPKAKKNPTREEYAFLNSVESVEEKKKIVTSGGFMEMLIATGDINKCIEAAREQSGPAAEPYGNIAPPAQQPEESTQSSGLSEDDLKILHEMQRSSGWSRNQSFAGTGDMNPAAPYQTADSDPEDNTGGNGA